MTPLSPNLHQQLLNSLDVSSYEFQPVGGGSINQTGKLRTEKGPYFCKINSATKFPQLFRKEASGLKALAAPKILAVPEVIHCLEDGKQQVLVLEWIHPGERSDAFWKAFGSGLAQLHQCWWESFGWDESNYMGSVPQDNTPSPDWTSFFRDRRLKPLVERCQSEGLLSVKHLLSFDHLYERLSAVFEPGPPSLLHGDLWSGNFMCNTNSEPVLIDPAVYYGHPSMDLAMTTLFGGFRPLFYEAYHYHSPFPPNHEEQWEICNLYPLLIHLLLFGRSYLGGIEDTLRRYG